MPIININLILMITGEKIMSMNMRVGRVPILVYGMIMLVMDIMTTCVTMFAALKSVDVADSLAHMTNCVLTLNKQDGRQRLQEEHSLV
jgi:hypothetical protein